MFDFFFHLRQNESLENEHVPLKQFVKGHCSTQCLLNKCWHWWKFRRNSVSLNWLVFMSPPCLWVYSIFFVSEKNHPIQSVRKLIVFTWKFRHPMKSIFFISLHLYTCVHWSRYFLFFFSIVLFSPFWCIASYVKETQSDFDARYNILPHSDFVFTRFESRLLALCVGIVQNNWRGIKMRPNQINCRA